MLRVLILNDSALSGGFDVLRSTHQGALIVCRVNAGILTQPTPISPSVRPVRADLALSVGCVSRVGKRLGGHGVGRGVTRHDAFSGRTK